ncbi:hypothetical protein TCAL_16204 [Tigriopus californicus]|uniref:Major facilitator superfamily (MFS) profile domain-containing protein n=1 Tax=Tigriopus californicus TaxID=6832 RepID=A0A553P4Z9_TIGCA|nr:hypothetical protein TCAL_16204 [Tigriopus californicus]
MKPNCQIRGITLRWMLQILFNSSMLSVGLCLCIRGPALLRMQFKYETSIESMSYMFLVTSIGGIFGVATWTMLLEAFPSQRLFIFGINVILFGVSTASIPRSEHLESLLIVCSWNGFHLSAITAGFIAPMFSKPFIGESVIPSPMHVLFGLACLPNLIIGSLLIVYAFLFRAHFAATNSVDIPIPIPKQSNNHKNTHTVESNYIIALMFMFFLIHILVEASIFNYLSTVGVKSELHLSEREGADVLAVFMGGFSAVRALVIPLAFMVNPHRILVFNLTMYLIGSILLANFAESSAWMMKIGYGLSGLGMGCMYANAWVWMESYVNVKYRVGSLLHLAIVFSSMMSPLVIGSLVESMPMILIYVQMGVAVTSCGIFSVGTILGARIKQKSRIPQIY